VTVEREEADHLIRTGHALEDRGDLDDAIRQYEAAAVRAPTYPRPLLNIGNVLQRQGRVADAVTVLERAIALDPAYAPSHFNLGLLHLHAEQFAPAERMFRAALRIDPDFDDAALALANLCADTQRRDEAETLLRQMMRGDRTHPRTPYALARLLLEGDRIDEAEACLTAAVAADPHFAPAYAAMGTLCLRTGRVAEADAWYQRALHVDPDDMATHGARLFALNARADVDGAAIFDAHREFGNRVAPIRDAQRPLPARRIPDSGRLRIGYLSGDFCQHAVALFLRPVLAHHDRRRFEICGYHTQRLEDPVTAELRALADRWRNIAALEDPAAAELIRADGIDVLIDLSGHTAWSRVTLFERRCAPVQMTWLGYLNTTGLASADFRICDGYTDPPGMTEHLYTERLLRMPHSQWCYTPAFRSVERTREGAPHIVLGSFNQFWKISEPCLDGWVRLLHALPDARLLVVGVPAGRTAERFRTRLAAGGIAPGRVSLMPRVDAHRYAALIAGADIALDTFPYNGATTTLDALWLGTPLVAIRGERPISRGSFSILSTLELPDLIADDADTWLALNVRLARDRPWRTSLQQSLRQRLEASPLMDAAAFTRDLEQLLEAAHASRRPGVAATG
jgi:protein O-GlcNAc transferase